MRYTIPALIILPALALSACAIIPQSAESLPVSTPPLAPQPASQGLIGLGQTADLGVVTLRPEAVIEDSRCPMNARCVWAGRVVVDATVWKAGRAERRQLTLGAPAADGVMLDTAEPGRTTDGPIAPQDYRFHFSIQTR